MPDVTQPGQRALLNAGLAGSVVLSLPSLATGVGPRACYMRALDVRRVVWFSGEFQHAHPTLVNICLARLALAAHRCAVMSERENCLARVPPGLIGLSLCLRGCLIGPGDAPAPPAPRPAPPLSASVVHSSASEEEEAEEGGSPT